MAAATSLQNLNDIIVPTPVPAWPPAPGWYVLLALLLLGILSLSVFFWRRWRQRAYRRAALAELRAIGELELDSTQSVNALTEILKRTALVAYPRAEVAALSGSAWWAFLDARCSALNFCDELGPLSDTCRFEGREPAAKDLEDLRRATATWVAKHRAAAHLETT
jgi:hypothetical protein